MVEEQRRAPHARRSNDGRQKTVRASDIDVCDGDDGGVSVVRLRVQHVCAFVVFVLCARLSVE